jgi:phosphoenolpyruvate carboxykinase (GTP)
MAMLPFCGYNMADYFGHWLKMGAHVTRPPQIFRVNWFRTDERGKFLWPGYGDNLRVLKWVLERCEGRGGAVDTPIGLVPTLDAIDRSGLSISDETMAALLRVDAAEWVEAVSAQENFFDSFGDRLPPGILQEHHALSRRINEALAPPESSPVARK